MNNDSTIQPLRTTNPCVTYKNDTTIKKLRQNQQKCNPGFRDDMYFSVPWGYSKIYNTQDLRKLCVTTTMLGAVGGCVCALPFMGGYSMFCTQPLEACAYTVGGMAGGVVCALGVGTCVVTAREVEDRYCLDCSKALMAKRAKQIFQCGCQDKKSKPIVSQPRSIHDSCELILMEEGNSSGKEKPPCENTTRAMVHGYPFGESENGSLDTCSIDSQESSFLGGVRQLFSHGSGFFFCGGSHEDFDEQQDDDEPSGSLFGLQSYSTGPQQSEEGEDRKRKCSDPWIPRSTITTQPKVVGGSLPTISKKVTTVFVPEHSRKGQIQSLQALQTALVDASEYVSSTLKFLTITMYTHTTVHPESSHTIQSSPSTLFKHQRRVPISHNQSSNSVHLFGTNQFFAFIDKQMTNLEQKVSSGRFGIISRVSPKMHIGLAYSRGQEMSKEHRGIHVDKSIGSANVTTKTDGLSGIIAWNIRNVGFTVYCAGCYDTGTILNIRYSTHGNQCMKTKGNPTITMTGGLFQLGYTLPLFQSAFLKPYIESLHSRVTWKTYEETYGPLRCAISSNTENIWEQRIGLHSHWKVSEVMQLQLWIANVFGQRKMRSLRSRPLSIPTELFEVFIPRQHRKYKRIEIGIAHDAILDDSLTLRLHGNVYRTNARKIDTQQIGCYLMYQY